MALTVSEALREARSIPVFNCTNEYQLPNYLRDVNIVLSLVPNENRTFITTVLANRLQGQALHAVETLREPTWDQIIIKLKQEFGVKESFFKLRNDALNVSSVNIGELHAKLLDILNKMNRKYNLTPENELFNPSENERNIFCIYTNYLPLYIKSLLIQNNISTINGAIDYYIENDLLKDIYIKGKQKSGPKKFKSKKWDGNGQNNYGPTNGNTYGLQGGNTSGYNNAHGLGHNAQDHEPMEMGNVNASENFHTLPQNPTYQ